MRTKVGNKSAAAYKAGGNELLRSTLDSMAYGYSVWDDDFRLSLVNMNYQKLYYGVDGLVKEGMSLQEVCALSVRQCNHPGLDAEALADLHKARFAQLPNPGDRLSVDKNMKGRVIRASYLRTEKVGWIVTHEDVTEQVAQQSALELREAQLAKQNMWLQAAVDHMGYGLCMFGPDKRLIICNQAYADIHRLPESLTVAGTRVEDIFKYRLANGLIPEEEQPEAYLARRMEIVAQRGREHHLIHREHGRLISIVCKPMADGGWVATHQDITEQRQREELIAERGSRHAQQNMRFNAAVNNMAHGLSMFDNERKLVICNQAYADLYGMPEHFQQPGTSFWDMLEHGALTGMVSIADRDERRQELEKVISDAEIVAGPITMLNGRTINVRHQPLADGGWLATHEDITEQHRSAELIRQLAQQDSLTGLANRPSFLAAMEAVEDGCREGIPAALFCIDFNGFKAINDRFGHAAGDKVLCAVAQRLETEIGDDGMVARLGGDEFAVVLTGISSRRRVTDIANRLLAVVAQPIAWEGLSINLGIGIGIALAPQHGTDHETLLRNADLALYAAKEDKERNYCFFNRSMHDSHEKRLAIDVGLRRAMVSGDLALHFQPIMSLESGRVRCCEALMRWQGDAGVVSPDDFIAVAEETGFIRELGGWALKAACAAAIEWPETVRVAVNVSPVQFAGRELLADVAAALGATGLAPERLELEITESLFLDDNAHNLKILHSLRDMGVRIALDDFGTGYSSLSYLRQFPFSKIKIDRSFISALSESDENVAIIKAVADLGSSFGMTVTAEGVETEAQRDVVHGVGCTEAQGYLYSPALPQTAIGRLISGKTQERDRVSTSQAS